MGAEGPLPSNNLKIQLSTAWSLVFLSFFKKWLPPLEKKYTQATVLGGQAVSLIHKCNFDYHIKSCSVPPRYISKQHPLTRALA